MQSLIRLALIGALGAGYGGLAPAHPSPVSPVSNATVVTAATENTDPAASLTDGAGALVMLPGDGAALGDWVQIGRATPEMSDGGYYGELRHLRSLGDELVAIGTINEPDEGPGHDVVFHSNDALTWAPVAVPGVDPTLNDLAATDDGFVLVGSDVVGGKRQASIWMSPDAVEWLSVPAPSVRGLTQIVSAADPLVVVGGNRLWASSDGIEWNLQTRMPGMSILRGPGGYLMWQAGGQDAKGPTFMLISADLSEWHELGLPKGLPGKGAFSGFQVFALADQWVLVPSEVKLPDAVFSSLDGETWQRVPRPPEMTEGAVGWMASIGDQTQGFGTVSLTDSDAAGLWAWALGEAAGDPATIATDGDLTLDVPVTWQGGYVSTGQLRGPDSDLSVWRLEPGMAG